MVEPVETTQVSRLVEPVENSPRRLLEPADTTRGGWSGVISTGSITRGPARSPEGGIRSGE
jgi:hypothetical protein